MLNRLTLTPEEVNHLVEIRHDLHAHPELGYEETRTSQVICRELTDAGVEFRAGLAGGTGVLGWIPGRDANDVVALRADMDALPIEEDSGVPWTSTNPGCMHACGHDGHTTMLIGAARALAAESSRGELPRPVIFVFQPAEEGGAGGRRMVQDGCLDGTVAPWKVSRIFGLHGWPFEPEGTLGTRVGPLLAAADHFEIVVRGRGSHAAMPHVGVDPIPAASAIVTALQTIVSRNIDPLEPAVISVTTIHAGSAFNVISPLAKLTGTARSLKASVRDQLESGIEQVAQQIALAHGCHADVNYVRGYPVTENHPDPVDRFNNAAVAEVGAQRVKTVEKPHMGGEDFSFYGEVVPACFFLMGLCPPEQGSMPSLHAPDFDFNDNTIETGVAMFRRLAIED